MKVFAFLSALTSIAVTLNAAPSAQNSAGVFRPADSTDKEAQKQAAQVQSGKAASRSMEGPITSTETDHPRTPDTLFNSEAAARYQKAAEAGDAEAQYILGRIYANGQGVSQNDELAVSWYRKSAEQGYANAQAILGIRYYIGRGVTHDLSLAASWIQKSAEQGNAMAEYFLGILSERGEGVPKDASAALAWYRKSAAQGNAFGQTSVGFMLQNGLGAAQDYGQAAMLYKKAAAQGYSTAQLLLGILYSSGQGVEKDESRAIALFSQAADQGNANAQYELALRYAKGIGLERNLKQAVSLYGKAADQGMPEAQNNLALLYADGEGVDQSYSQAATWYRRAAENGLAVAQYNLGMLYFNGSGVPQDHFAGEEWLEKAANQGFAPAREALRVAYLKGPSSESKAWNTNGPERFFKGKELAQVPSVISLKIYSSNEEAYQADFLRKYAEKGNADAQYKLGVRFLKGLGVSKSEPDAISWLSRAADQGSQPAFKELLLLGETKIGEGKIKSLLSAAHPSEFPELHLAHVYYPQKFIDPLSDGASASPETVAAAEKGDAVGQTLLGLAYLNGKDAPQDDGKALEWFQKAAAQGNPRAQFLLGFMYSKGRGTSKDTTIAASWLKKSAEQGHSWAQFFLGNWYLLGTGVEKDPNQAAAWFTKAAEQGNASSQYCLGLMYFRGLGLAKNLNAAKEWLVKARKGGDIYANDLLRRIEAEEAASPDAADAEQTAWLRKNAERGNAVAQYKLAIRYRDGKGTVPDTQQAMVWFRKAAAQGNADALKDLISLLDTVNPGASVRQKAESLATTARGEAAKKKLTDSTEVEGFVTAYVEKNLPSN